MLLAQLLLILWMYPAVALLLPRKSLSTRIIDLRSDTLTKPSEEMRKAMAEAVVGDDVFHEDPTVNELEKRIAKLFDKEKALYFPTGTMSNLVAAMAVCTNRGSEVILGDKSHMFLFEQSNLAQIGGISPRAVSNRLDGTINMESLEMAIRADNVHFPVTEMIALENTHNYCGGRVLPSGYTEAVGWLANKKNLHLHMDGARIWNAAVASGTSLSKLAEPVDSISVCLSKGLGAPAGSVLAGSKDMIKKARRLRKALGGGMRQVGVLAAAGMVAIDDFESGMLEADHLKAKIIADALSVIPGIRVDAATVDSNIVIVHLEYDGIEPYGFASQLKEKGVLVLPFGPRSIRIVIHRDLSDEDIKMAIFHFRDVAARAWVASAPSGTAEQSQSEQQILQHPAVELQAQIVPPAAITSKSALSGRNFTAAVPASSAAPPPGHKDIVDIEKFIEHANNKNATHYEEVLIRGMTLSDDGFCVLLWGTISERCLKVIVTPQDPLAEGLDREEVETSEAVTLLQLFQGIDVQTFLPKDLLESMFTEHSKDRHKLKLVQIDSLTRPTTNGNNDSDRDKKRKDSGFEANLIARKRNIASDHSAGNTKEEPKQLEQPPLSRPKLSLPFTKNRGTASDDAASVENSNSDGASSASNELSDVPFVDTRMQVKSTSAFTTIALALRHQATIEVCTDLLHDEELSYSTEELLRYFPRLVEAVTPLPTLDASEGLSLKKRLPRRLAEARRQQNDAKSAFIIEMMNAYGVPVPPALALSPSESEKTRVGDLADVGTADQPDSTDSPAPLKQVDASSE